MGNVTPMLAPELVATSLSGTAAESLPSWPVGPGGRPHSGQAASQATSPSSCSEEHRHPALQPPAVPVRRTPVTRTSSSPPRSAAVLGHSGAPSEFKSWCW